MGLISSKKTYNKTAALSVLLFFLYLTSTAQLDSAMHHQIGISSNRIFNGLFKHQINVAALNYNMRLKKDVFLRFGADFVQKSGEDGEFNIFGKAGIQYKIANYRKLRIYYGVDAFYNHEESFVYKTVKNQVGLSAFVGAAVIFTKNFAIATEPKLYGMQSWSQDKDSFDPSIKTVFYSGLTNIGQVQLRFMF